MTQTPRPSRSFSTRAGRRGRRGRRSIGRGGDPRIRRGGDPRIGRGGDPDRRLAAGLLAIVLALAGCGGAPPRPVIVPVLVAAPEGWDASAPDAGLDIARRARALVGASYRYGGATPRGFDCSGLVFRTFLDHGIRLPRTVRELLRSGRAASDLLPGDILFFRLSGRQVSHVGIYLGEGAFVHASSGRGRVVIDDLRDGPYFRERLVAVRRIVPLATH